MQRLINWFEIPVRDLDRARRFYEATFAVELKPEVMEGMHMAVFPCDAPATGGALLACPEGKPGDHGVVIYLHGGDDLSVPLARAVAAGATVLMPRTELSPEIGSIAMFADSEGNRIGLHSPGREA
ncbi:MAG: VOC family protein [Zoogloea sp.]|jgi:predicted enzyme related to lactoylglutathione lyase|nr:MAG: VOC family protein [Zoogloea sp.]